MNVCIVGDGLISLTLAKTLVNEGIYVDIFSNQKINKIDKSRTIGISKANVDFFNKNILDINKLIWKIKRIEIFSDNLKNDKILNFENDKEELFSVIKNFELYDYLNLSLKKNKLFRRKKNYTSISSKKYKLIIICDNNSSFSKKYFYKKISKDYSSCAYTTVIDHKNLSNNKTAIQFFTKKGPLAFLPISNSKTSIVYSVKNLEKIDFKNIIDQYNFKYKNIKYNKISKFNLVAKDLRTYYSKNILAFGDMLHKLHPLAGQGFNMSVRDIRLLIQIIRLRIKLGLDLDGSICSEFEKKMKHKNFFFSNSVDLIYEFFNFEGKFNNSFLSKSVQFFGKNKSIKKYFINVANKGLVI